MQVCKGVCLLSPLNCLGHAAHVHNLPSLPAGLTEGQAMVMFNPRLASGDVGVGLSVSAWSNAVLLQHKHAGCPLRCTQPPGPSRVSLPDEASVLVLTGTSYLTRQCRHEKIDKAMPPLSPPSPLAGAAHARLLPQPLHHHLLAAPYRRCGLRLPALPRHVAGGCRVDAWVLCGRGGCCVDAWVLCGRGGCCVEAHLQPFGRG